MRIMKLILLAVLLMIIVNSVAFSQNKCLSLSVRGDYLKIPHCEAINFTTNFTVEFWGSIGSDNALAFYKRGNKNKGYGLSVNSKSIGLSMFSRIDVVLKRNVEKNLWNHYVFVKRGGTNEIYVNGILVRKQSGKPGVYATSSDILIGPSVNGDGSIRDYFTGKYDELRLWNRDLTEREIKNNINKELTGRESGLVGYYKFNAMLTGNKIEDHSQTGNHAIMVNGAELITVPSLFGGWESKKNISSSGKGKTKSACDGFSSLFCDDFEDGADPSWVQSRDANATWEVVNGTWHVTLSGYKRHSYQSIGNSSWTDYVLEMDLRGNEGVDKSIAFRGYSINFRSDWAGKDELMFAAPGGYVDIIEFPSANGNWYHLEMRCDGPYISVSIDGAELITYEDVNQLSMSGGITLQAFSGAPSICDMNFDNITVTAIEPDVPSIQQPILSYQNKALRFDGIDDVLTIANGKGSVVNNFTVEMWVKPKATQEIDAMQAKGVGGIRGQRYLTYPAHGDAWEDKTRIHSGAALAVGINCISVYEHAGNYMPPLLVYPCNLTNWTHIALVYKNRQPVLYLNGAFVMRGLQSPRLQVHLGLSQLGGQSYGYFSGDVDEVRYWSRALTPEEIKKNMNWSLSGSEEGLELYYDCNKMTSDGRLNDLSGNDHIGTLTGGASLVESTCPVTKAASEKLAKEIVRDEQPIVWVMPSRPADLYIESVKFLEPSGNQALDGYESGSIEFMLKNNGLGEAQNINIILSPLMSDRDLIYKKEKIVESIESKSSHSVSIPISAEGSVETLKRSIRIQANEEFGFDADPIILSFETVAFNPPELQINKIAINDREEGDAYGNGNSIIEPNESIVVSAFVQNLGTGIAEDVRAIVILNSSDRNISCPDQGQEIVLGNIPPGDYKPVEFYFFTSKRYSQKDIPLKIQLTESKGDYGKTFDLGLKMNARTDNIIDVNIAKIDIPTPEIKEIEGFSKSDIDEVGTNSKTTRSSSLAVIIGIESYKYTSSASYASRDAGAFYQYATKILGIPDANVYYLVDDGATMGEFSKLFDENGWLSRRVTENSDIFVFYSGHGAPDIKSKVPYIIPYDIDPNYAQSGYSSYRLYKNLSELNAKSVIVMLDACFIGQNKESEMLLADARPALLAVTASSVPPNVTLLAASSANQISSGYPSEKHGIFSYYLMKGMSPESDIDKDGKITLGELYDYLYGNVKSTAGRLDREQTPELINGKREQVICEF